MSTTIDERVVEMRFDNKQFESGVQTSMSTLDKLKNSLNMNGATKGFEQIDNAAKKVNMSSLGNAVESVRLKFSSLQVIAVTALSSITNSIINTGKQLISSLTIEPIKTGFQEYETQINAVQTILANTQATTKQVVKQVSSEAQAEIEATLNATIESNEKSIDNLKKTHKEQLRSYEKLADEELEALEDKQDAEIDALEDYIDDEMKLLKSSHKEKLDLYEEEYMEKLKVIDEERYSKIKAVEDQINAINALTESEEEQLKLQKQTSKLAELQKNIDTATTYEDRLKAEEKLAEYKAEIEREQLLKERKAQIELLELSKKSINAEYDAKEEQLKEEYNSKKEQENELYDLKVENLKEESEARKKSLNDIHDEEKKLLKEQLSLEKEAIQERQDAEIDALNATNEVAINNIKARLSAGAQVETINIKPSTLQDVNNALDELNKYADKTIYNFTEMTRNIGTFTAAGIDLDTSVTAIKGIANLAAVSGSTSEQASRAMYQLSQALSSGTVKLTDWNSVVSAGMGGQVFQDALKETARVQGVAIDNLIAKYGSFRETLQTGWLTADILTETLKKFTMSAEDMTEAQIAEARAMYKATGYTEEQIDAIFSLGKTATEAATKVKTVTQLMDTLKESAQSGWTQTWELLVGDFEEAKKTLTEVSKVVGDIISKSADARNEVLSGGLSSGWKQLLDAGIADETGYIDSIKEVAKANGDAFDKIVSDSDDFSDALKKGLKEGVISSETLSNAVFNLQRKMSGMTDEEKKAAGYTAEMIAQIETLASGLKDGSISMDEFIKKIIRPSGRENIIQALWNAAKGLASAIAPIKEAFRDIFPPMTAEQLYNITNGLLKLTENLKLSDTASANLKSTFKGLFSILDIIKQVFSAAFTAIKPLFGGFESLGGGILGVTGRIGESITAFDEFLKSSGILNEYADKIATSITNIIDKLSDFKDAVKEKIESANFEWLYSTLDNIGKILGFIRSEFISFKDKIKEKFDSASFEWFHSLLERIHTRMSQVGAAAGEMKSAIVVAFEIIGEALSKCNFVRILGAIWNVVKIVGSGIIKIFSTLGKNLSSNLGQINFSNILDLINGISLGAIAIGITKFIKSFKEVVSDISSIKDSFVGILDGVRGCLESFQTQLKANTLLKIASAIAILAASIIAISLINSDKLNSSLGAITILFADLMGSMAIFSKISGKTSGVTKSVTAMLGIATAVLILAGALKMISDLDIEQLKIGTVGIVSLTTMMVASAKILSSGGKTIVKGAAQMVMFAVAIKVLASVCEDLSNLSWDQLKKGLVGVGVLLAEVSLFMRTAKFSTKTITTATGIVILSSAIKILASACKDFGEMEWEEIKKGLAAITGLLIEITAFTKLTGNAKHIISTGLALIEIGAAMKILASALNDFGNMEWEEIIKGLTAMAVSLAAVTLAVNFMPKNMIGIGTGLIVVSSALLIIANALNKMGAMTWDEIVKGLVALGVSIGILAKGLTAMSGTISGSAALLVAAAAILVLAPALAILGAMGWESIIKGLVTLAGAFVILGVAGLVLSPLAPIILALSGALALIGVGIVGIGAGLILIGIGLSSLAIGLTAFSASVTAGATAIVASIAVIITGILGLIPEIVLIIGDIIVAICEAIVNSATAIGEALKTLILVAIDVLVECIPSIADGILAILDGVLKALVEYTPSIVDSLLKFLIEVLESLADNLPELIKAAVDVLMALFTGIVDAFKGYDAETLIEAIAGIGLLAAIVAALSAIAPLIPGAMIGVLGMGAVIAELALVLAAVGGLAQIPGLNWLINEGGELLQNIGTAIGKFIGGIVGGFMSGVSSQFPQIGSDLSGFMTNVQPFLEGAASIDPSMLDGVKALAEIILLLTAADILNGLTSWLTGGSSLSGFAEELVPFGKAMKQFSEEVKGIDGETVSNAAIAGKTLAEMASTLPNTGGVVGFFAGENDMGVFAEQIVPFGTAMKAFSDEVKGLDAAVVAEAATAGKAMAEMAATIPNSGGIVGFFAGENDMTEFGEQLVPFGKAMKDYGDAVAGIKVDVIQNSVTAGKTLMELADTVPNTGGVVAWFTGDNDIDDFGEKLVPFGKAMKEYGDAVKGIKASIITDSANAASALVKLSNNLPNTGGLVSWFTGDNDIASFGKQLVTFGGSFADYYKSVKDVDVTKLSGVVDAFSDLVDLAKGIKSIDTSGMSKFAKDLKSLGKSGIDEFIKGFDDSKTKTDKAVDTMLTNFMNKANSYEEDLDETFESLVDGILSAISDKNMEFANSGNDVMAHFKKGAESNDSSARSLFTSIISGCLESITTKYQEFKTAGITIISNVINGIKTERQSPKTEFTTIVNDCLSFIQGKCIEFYNAGQTVVKEFANGINSYIWYAEAKSREMAKAAAEAAEDELDVNSPSKVSYRIGGFFGKGFVNSITDYCDKSYKAGSDMATSAKDGLRNTISKISDYIDSSIDSQPTIKPILDLSQVKEGAGQLSAMLSKNQAMAISSGIEREATSKIQNDNTTPAVGNSYSFVQNNYSPKALSRIDIYRQTKNQFSAMKGLVEI